MTCGPWILEKSNEASYPYRIVLVDEFLHRYPSLSIRDLTPETVEFLISRLGSIQFTAYVPETVLARIATQAVCYRCATATS